MKEKFKNQPYSFSYYLRLERWFIHQLQLIYLLLIYLLLEDCRTTVLCKWKSYSLFLHFSSNSFWNSLCSHPLSHNTLEYIGSVSKLLMVGCRLGQSTYRNDRRLKKVIIRTSFITTKDLYWIIVKLEARF